MSSDLAAASLREDLMMSYKPYFWINDSARLPVLAVLVAASLILTFSLSLIAAGLTNETAPCGVISFELAGSLSRAREIMRSWEAACGCSAREDVFLSIGLDYLYLCVYPLAISMACDLAANRIWARQSRMRIAGVILAWVTPVAGAVDAIENYAMIRVLKFAESPVWPSLAKCCAIPKFGLVLLGLGYVGVSLLFLARATVLRRARPRT